MLDGWARKRIDPGLVVMGMALARGGVSANVVTLVAFGAGLGGAVAIVFHQYWLGLALVLASRLGDGLDGAVAKVNGPTDLGGYLDIVLDFVFYGAIPLAFVLANPGANAVAGAVLLLAFYANGASFLAYAVMAEKRRLTGAARGPKSFFFTTGLAEATETIIVFALMCIFPAWFPVLAYIFAAMTAWTTLSRIVQASRVFD
ncbi:MAG: CDP-alcohol phosphatidyltransferase family protein [Rhizobiaceae bacterium]|nr:CDP-alcohol phosphatidyltransferase family protein [Rhizobiaceae bacterium]MCV0405904.1 CDP-alcohol phosphatidyltransferase family protein [Rhizobiaceae bacterium]